MRANPFLNEMIDFDPDMLDQLSLGAQVETPISDYPEIGVLSEYIEQHLDDEPVKINIKKLAKHGVVKQDDMKDYLASKNLPSSGLKEVLKNPANFFFYLNDRDRIYKPDKAYFELGTFIHMAFLEPKLFKKVKTEPEVKLSTTEGCKKLCQFYYKLNRDKSLQDFDSMKIADLRAYIDIAKGKCKYMMIQEEHKLIIEIAERNYKSYGGGIIPKIMKGAAAETSFYGVDAETGLKIKVRPDAINIKENIGVNAIISVKSTAAPTIEKFMYDSAKFQYELSEAMYQRVISDITGEKFNATIMIMIQTVAPFQPAVLFWSPEDLQNGYYKYRYALDTAKQCLESGKYPGYESLAEEGNHGIIMMKQPQWAHKLLKPLDLDN